MKTTLEVLEFARAFLSDRVHWAQHARYGRMNGSEFACSLGAIDLALGISSDSLITERHPATYRLAQAIHELRYGRLEVPRAPATMVVGFNDNSTHSHVLRAFDRAIELEKAEMDRVAEVLVESVPAPETVEVMS